MNSPYDSPPDQDALKAIQLLSAGTHPTEIMNQLKNQGLSDEQAQDALRRAFFESKRELYEKGAKMLKGDDGVLGLLKVGVPIVIVVSFILSAFLTVFIGLPLGLIGGTIVLVMMVKKKMNIPKN
jgi:hypothetical protein